MNPQTTSGFKLVDGGRPTPPPEPPAPNPNAPIALPSGTFEPLHGRFVVSLKGPSIGAIAPVYTDEATARELDALLEGRHYAEAMSADFTEARRRLAESSSSFALAGSRSHFGHYALYAAHRTGDGAVLRELATFDPRLAGLAAALSASRVPTGEEVPSKGWRFALWSVAKERRRCGLTLRPGNKEQTIIEAQTLPAELAGDWQIIVLGTAKQRATAAA